MRLFYYSIILYFFFSGLHALGMTDSGKNFSFPHFFVQDSRQSENYLLRFSKGQMQFSPTGVTFGLFQVADADHDAGHLRNGFSGQEIVSEMVQMNFEFSNSSCEIQGIEPLASKSNYFTGSNSSDWQVDLQNYNAIYYKNLYDYTDLKYYIEAGAVKYDYIIHPGGQVDKIRMKYSGIRSLLVDKDGTLCIQTGLTELKDYLPKSYQVIDGVEIPVRVEYKLIDEYTVGFVADKYDEKHTLIIDPVLIYSTFVGGSSDDYQWVGGIDHDATGNIYHTGRTFSSDFPTTPGVLQQTFGGSYDVFIFKLDPTGSNLVYSTLIGGNATDAGYSLKVEQGTGNLWVVGSTDSPTFPVTASAFQTVPGGTGLTDAFVLKLNSTGDNILYSSLFGQAYSDYGHGIDIDDNGIVYITGECNGPVYTTPGAFQSVYGGGPWDGWIVKLDSTLSTVLYSTMFGGFAEDVPISIKVYQNSEVYISGFQSGGGMPVVPGSFDVTYNGGAWDGFVAKFNSILSTLLYSTYLGTPGTDMIWNALQLGQNGEAVVAGFASSGFPTTAGAFQTLYGGGAQDVFVTRLNSTGTSLIYSTYLGGNGNDQAYGLYMDLSENVYITGFCQDNYPMTICTYDSTYNGVFDAFISQLSPGGDQLIFSTYIGGADNDRGYCITVFNNTIFVTGETRSADFPVSNTAVDQSYNGSRDIFALAMVGSSSTVIADFSSPVVVCPNSIILFNNLSVGSSNFIWDFGDGNTSIDMDPQYSYSTPGYYFVQLIANSTCAMSDTFTVVIQVADLPQSGFLTSLGCNHEVEFFNTSLNALNYYWNFGDSQTSLIQSPNHIYALHGIYDVTLVVENMFGCFDTLQQQITVAAQAVANFNIVQHNCSMQIDVQNTSSNTTTFQWHFGDGNYSLLNDPSHIYNSEGTYTIMLIANPWNCPDTSQQFVTILERAEAFFNFTTGCNNDIQLYNTSSLVSISFWDFGDGSTSNDHSPSHSFSVPGDYTISLLVEDTNGCQDLTTQIVQVRSSSVASFNYPSVICSQYINFQNTTLNGLDYLWSFGDGSFDTVSSPGHLYANPGNYIVSLISNPGNCPDTMSALLTVSAPLFPLFSESYDCEMGVQFANSSLNANQITWNFGDGISSNDPSPFHIYPDTGQYLVGLKISNFIGCEDSIFRVINIRSSVISEFIFSDTICTTLVEFFNMSENSNYYLWDFGDGIFSYETNPVHEYTIPGIYQVKLLTSDGVCSDSTLRQVFVSEGSKAHFNSQDTCSLTRLFQNNSLNNYQNYWLFGDGTTSTDSTPSHTYAQNGMYEVMLTITSPIGCMDSISSFVAVKDYANVAFEMIYDSCLQHAVFINQSIGANSYLWDFQDGSQSSENNPQHVFEYSGLYNIVLVTDPETRCEAVLNKLVEIPEREFSYLFIPNTFTPNGDGLNDCFQIVGRELCLDYTLSIFNRWGSIIYESTDIFGCWDGTLNGKIIEGGVYTYLLRSSGASKHGIITVLH